MEHDTDSANHVKAPRYYELGDAGIGNIQARGPEQTERLDELTERLQNGEFHVAIDWDAQFKKMILARCVDGRLPEDGLHSLAPNTAGGTESLFVADDLTARRFAAADGTTASGFANSVRFLVNAGYEVGGHTSTHASGQESGCGANDKLPAIYEYIASRGDTLRSYAATLGIIVSDHIHELITSHARERSQFSHGRELLETLQVNARSAFMDNLGGEHHEVAAVINKKPGTTLDRAALHSSFGDSYQAFNVDAWAFDEAARVISVDDQEEIEQKKIALLYYNLATAFVLSGPDMRIVVVE